jgi:hypothetical protein
LNLITRWRTPTRAGRLDKWQRELWLFVRRCFDDRVFTNPYENNDLARCMAARKNISPIVGGKAECRQGTKAGGCAMNVVKDEHKATLRQWHESCRKSAVCAPASGVRDR